MDKDSTLIPMGKGALFVPYVIGTDRDPPYRVYQNGKFIADGEPGVRLALEPGNYTVEIGTGPEESLIKIDVAVSLERVTSIPASWSALIVNMSDSFGNPLRMGYMIAEEQSKLIIGTGLGTDESRGEKPQVWILKPGLYRVLKKGESADGIRNFITVRTVAGSASSASLYFDETTSQLTGGGETAESMMALKRKGNWSFKVLVSGLLSMVNSGTLEENNDITYYNLGSRLNGSLIYDKDCVLFSNKLDIYESFVRENNERFLSTIDIARFQSLGVYRFTKNFGPYTAFYLKTRLFNNYKDYDETSTDIRLVEPDGSYTIESGSKPFLISKTFSPSTLRESFGFNSDFQFRQIFSVSARLGWAFKQIVSQYLYDDSKDNSATPEKDVYRVEKLSTSYGPELSLYFSWMPLDFIELKEDFLGMMSVNSSEGFSYTSESSAALWLSRFANIQYSFWLEKDLSIAEKTKKYHTMTVQLFYRFY